MKTRQLLQVPGVRLLPRRRPSLHREDLERRQPYPGQAGDRPAVPRVGVPEAGGVAGAAPGATQEIAHIQAAPGRGLQGGHGLGQGRAGRGAHGRVLLADQSARLRRPGQQLGVQDHPAGAELVPEPGLRHRRPQPVHQPGRQGGVVEERAPGAGVHGAAGAVGDPEPRRGVLRGAGQHGDGPRAHVLLLAHDLGDPRPAELLERLGGVLQVAVQRRGLRRGHGRRQVDQPARVHGEPAHDLQRRRGVLLPDLDLAAGAYLHVPGALDVADVQQPWVAPGGRGQRAGGLVPDPLGRHRDQLARGVAQGGEPPAEHAARVQADRVVDPLGLGDGRVAVHDHGPAPVVLGPRVAHRQAVLVGLACRVAVEREGAHPSGGAAVVGLLQPGVRHHQRSAVELVVADQAVHERLGRLAELLRLAVELLQGPFEAVRDRDLAAVQRPHELLLVVAGHAQRRPRRHHAHDQPQYAGRVGASVDQVADEDGGPALGVNAPHRPSGVVPAQRPSELGEQRLQLRAAAVHVPDEVEGAGQLTPVGPGLLVGDLDVVGGLAPEHVHAPEAVPGDLGQRPPQVLALPGDHVRAEGPVGTQGVARDRDLLRHVQHDRVHEHVVALGQLDELPAGLPLDVGGVHDGEQPSAQPGADDVVQHVEGVRGRLLVVLVVGDQAPAEVRGDHLGRLEVPAGERRLAAARHAHQQHERQPGHADLSHGRTPPSGSAARPLDRPRRPAGTSRGSRTPRRLPRPRRRTPRGSTRSGGPGGACRSGTRT